MVGGDQDEGIGVPLGGAKTGLDGVIAKPKLKSVGESKDTSDADYDYEYDEKHKTVAPTERGVGKAEEFLGVENLYISEHGTLVNHLVQSLKAESLYRRDKDYAVVDGQVMIIDEHTGRILEGRRWSEGLHQAVEAKEGAAIQNENQTLASITFQNYFRMYGKLAGMTGTADTEAYEFQQIYGLETVVVPTHMKMIRADRQVPLEYVVADAGAGLQAGIATAQQQRQKHGQRALENGLDVFHTTQEARRVLRQLWSELEGLWEQAEAASRRVEQAQSQDASSTLRLYRAALRLRREFRGARILSWREAPAGVLAFGVDTGLACTANMSEKPVRIQAPGTLLLASQEVALDGASAVLPPRSAAWWREYSNRVGATIHSEGP
jgi:hypothetical protein